MQMSPKAAAAQLAALLSQEGEGAQDAESRDTYIEGCEIEESHDMFRHGVSPEEFFNVVNEELEARGLREGGPPVTWDELYLAIRDVERKIGQHD
jgi:hypothetical protein